MAAHDLTSWQHDHAFDPGNRAAERRTWIVVAITAITAVTMVADAFTSVPDIAPARALVDREMDAPVVAQIRAAIESDGDAAIADLHVWRVGRAAYSAVLTVVADRPLTPGAYRERVASIPALAHVPVEVKRCPGGDC